MLIASIRPDLFTAVLLRVAESHQSKKVFASRSSICAAEGYWRARFRARLHDANCVTTGLGANDDDEMHRRVWTGNPTFARIFFMDMIPDGTYDVIVVDAEPGDDGDLHIEVTISLGPRVGDVISLRGRHVESKGGATATDDPFALLGVPGTLRVRDGQPTFRPETR
jgi:hypothetical protein